MRPSVFCSTSRSATVCSVFLALFLVASAQGAWALAVGVGAQPAPSVQAAFAPSVAQGTAPLAVSFDDQSTGSVDSWNWDFGDGNTSSQAQPSHTYSSPGWYSVTLTVTSGGEVHTLQQRQAVLVATTIRTVGPGASGGLQGALDAAGDWELIQVSPGTFHGSQNRSLEFGGRRVYLKATGGPGGTVLDAQGSGRLFEFGPADGPDTVVEGFTLRGGVASQGGAMRMDGGGPTVRGCVFEGNSATAEGGAIYANRSDLVLVNCVFENNTSVADGAAACLLDCDAGAIEGCSFSNNRTQRNGGAVSLRDSDTLVRDCHFSQNSARFKGGAVYTRSGSRPLITNCLLENNTAGSGGAVYATTGGPRMEWCTLRGNSAGQGGGLWAYRALSTRLIRCDVTGNAATSANGGGLGYFFTEGGEITSCRITGNTAAGHGGGVSLDDESRPAFSGTLLVDNTAAGEGGGLWCRYQVYNTLANCVVAGNQAAVGGALYADLGSVLELDNTIVYGNSAPTAPGIFMDGSALARLDHSAYGNATDHVGTLTLNASIPGDPRFTGPGAGNYRLQTTSPCVDAGSNTLVPSVLSLDLDGSLRIAGNAVDVGAFEGTAVAVPTLTVLAPNGGEAFAPGAATTLRWTSGGGVGNVELFYSLNGGGSWTSIATTSNDGSHAWTLPTALTTRGRIRVKEVGSNVSDTSDGDFVIDVVTAPGSFASLPYTSGFEAGAVDAYWETRSDEDGRVRILQSNGPHGGASHLTMDDETRGGYSTNEAWLRLDLSGHSQVQLSFWWKEFGEETHGEDGVFFSDDGGLTFTKVAELDGSSTANDTWQERLLDVDVLAAMAGLSLTPSFVVKFQQYDNYPMTSDGIALDDVAVSTGTAPAPSVSVTFPNGGENLPAGSNVLLTWSSTGDIDQVALEYSGDGGLQWTSIDGSTANDGAFSWQAPVATTTQGRLRVTALGVSGIQDTSDGSFSIVADDPPASVGPASLPYATGFESGLDAHWTTSSTAEGRIETTTSHGPAAGSFHLTMDDHTRAGAYSRNEAWLYLDLAGEPQVTLTFAWKEFGDETHPEDGVFLSGDGGATFVKVLELRGADYANNSWQAFELDLDELAAAAGVPLSETSVVKFQQIDNYPIGSDGIALDDIAVLAADTGGGPGDGPPGDGPPVDPGPSTAESEPNDTLDVANGPVGTAASVAASISTATDEDWFAFDVVTGSTVSISVAIGSGADLDFYLYDHNGVQLGRQYTTSNPEAGSFYLNSGRYYVKVNGYRGATSDYGLTLSGALAKAAADAPDASFALHPNVPNPFNPSTRIAFDLPHGGRVRLAVYNARGQRVAVLLDEFRKEGSHSVVWHGRDSGGRPVASGVYVYRIEAPGYTVARKMTLTK